MTLHLKVKPNAKSNSITKGEQGLLHVRIAAPAIDGKANKKLIAYLAEVFNCSASKINLLKGETNSFKTVEVSLPNEQIQEILNKLS